MSPTLSSKPVGAIGYGLMGLSWRAQPQPLEDSLKVMKAALESGANFWNGGLFYGTPAYNSLHILNAYFTRYPEDADKVVISIKAGLNLATHTINASKEYLDSDVHEALRLADGKFKIDIFECARVDPNVPIETTVAALHEHVKAGRIGGIGLSECGAATIRRAAAVAPITSVEVEFSLFSPDILTNGVASACAELGIPIAAYSPLSRGLLTGEIRSFDDLPQDDLRRRFPRFQPENFENNMRLVHACEKLAEAKGCRPANIALAWVRACSGRTGLPTIIPIPGTTTVERLGENMREVELTEAEFEELGRLAKEADVKGGRYPAAQAHLEFA